MSHIAGIEFEPPHIVAEMHQLNREAKMNEQPDREHPIYAPQGREEQGWPMRRCSPEMACWDPDDQTDSADAEVLAWLAKGAAYMLAVVSLVWFLNVMAAAL